MSRMLPHPGIACHSSEREQTPWATLLKRDSDCEEQALSPHLNPNINVTHTPDYSPAKTRRRQVRPPLRLRALAGKQLVPLARVGSQVTNPDPFPAHRRFRLLLPCIFVAVFSHCTLTTARRSGTFHATFVPSKRTGDADALFRRSAVVAQLAVNQLVAGSNPAAGATF